MTCLRLVWSSNGWRRCRSNPNPSDVMRLFKEMGATRRQLRCGTAERATGVVGRLTISRGSGLLNTTIMDEVTAQLTRRLSAHLSLLSRCSGLLRFARSFRFQGFARSATRAGPKGPPRRCCCGSPKKRRNKTRVPDPCAQPVRRQGYEHGGTHCFFF